MLPEAVAEIVQENVHRVRAEIATACTRVGRSPDEVTLIGVTKSVTRPVADVLVAAGVRDLGENRVQDAVAKFGRRSPYPPLPADVRLHMIGNAQTNKARDIAHLFRCVHSINRPAIADALDAACRKRDQRLSVLLEVNIAEDPSKQGAALSGLMNLYGYVVDETTMLDLVGLMTIAPMSDDTDEVRSCFRELRALRDRLQVEIPGGTLPMLSMGMSNDYVIAVEEGATHVRIGRALFHGIPASD